MEIFIQAKFEDYNSGGASQKAVRTVPPIRSQGTVMWVFWDRGLYIRWWITDILHNLDMQVQGDDESPLQDQEGTLPFHQEELSSWCWENASLQGWAGISANSEDLADA